MSSSELSAVFCYVYVLRSQKTKGFYVGFTHDVKARLAKHNQGLNRSTKAYIPWELLYYEAHKNEDDARRRERYLKTTAGTRAISNMLRMQLAEQSDLTKQKVYY